MEKEKLIDFADWLGSRRYELDYFAGYWTNCINEYSTTEKLVDAYLKQFNK